MVARVACASTRREAMGAREESIPPIRPPERSDPTQVAASANRGESAANRKECSLSHTSPAPRVPGRPSRDLRTGVERRLRPSARFSRGRTLLAACDAPYVPMEAYGAPIRIDWTVSAGERNRSEAKRSQETGERGDRQAGDCTIGTYGALSARRVRRRAICGRRISKGTKAQEGEASGRRQRRSRVQAHPRRKATEVKRHERTGAHGEVGNGLVKAGRSGTGTANTRVATSVETRRGCRWGILRGVGVTSRGGRQWRARQCIDREQSRPVQGADEHPGRSESS